MELPYIASLKHREQIDACCKDIKTQCGVDYFIIYIRFKNNQLFVLSNAYSHLNDYYQNGMYIHDSSTAKILFADKSYYLCDNDRGVSEPYSQILINKYSIHRIFYKLYSTSDFDLILGAASNNHISDKLTFYRKSINDFERFALNFINSTQSIFKDHNPELKASSYFNEQFILRNSLFNIKEDYFLTIREYECLTLTANGYTSDETAKVLGISKHTVEDYKKSIMKKLGAVNMPNAIYIAMKQNLLEQSEQNILPNVESIRAFRNLIQTSN